MSDSSSSICVGVTPNPCHRLLNAARRQPDSSDKSEWRPCIRQTAVESTRTNTTCFKSNKTFL